ncbi:unnamed protein product [Symbiodinium natans]|uniref:Uncharacterized protein n=1 Tax=Symbiodinium natans TaxID=878477 RepID=A0A812HMQ9_9DINO|nr:unnamed protein product [Symbiodinium natans]
MALLLPSCQALSQAQRRMPEHWTNEDQVMLDYVQAESSARGKFPIQDVHVWKLHGFRP